jgi:hypothetical protein
MMLVIIDYGAEEDWGELCYPPLEHAKVVSGIRGHEPLPR